MNLFPEDDRPLTNFLKQNRPSVPLASTNLEDQILTLVEITPQQLQIVERPQRRIHPRRPVLWFVTSAIAAGFVAIVVGHRSFMSSQSNEAELAELQTFIESTWDGTVAESPTATAEELHPLTEDPSLN